LKKEPLRFRFFKGRERAMTISQYKNRLIPLITLLAISSLMVAVGGRRPQQKRTSAANTSATLVEKGRCRVTIEEQPESPIRVVLQGSELADSVVPVVELTIVNISTNAIRAYTIKYETVSNTTGSGGWDVSIPAAKKAALTSGATASMEISGTTYAPPLNSMRVSVDFVEFADGSTWGPDKYNTRDRIGGMRAGAQAARERLSEVLTTSGPEAVMRTVNERSADGISRPSTGSPQWTQGFEEGIGFIKARVREAAKSGDSDALRKGIEKPFGAAEEDK
jgi:hypothetical protein